MLAPRSSTTDSPRSVGQIAAIAGRSMPAIVRRLILAIAISAPVLPAETATSALPFFTASIASHIEDFERPCRRAWLGLSSILTATSVWMTRETAFSSRMPGENRFDTGLIAEKKEGGIGVARMGQRGARDHHRRTVVSPHGIERDADLVRHKRTLADALEPRK